jgi:hypothetical protein
MRIKVLQHHIDEGRRASHSCPVALALAEQTGRQWYVCARFAETRNDEGVREVITADGLHDFVMHFDSGQEPVEPVELEFSKGGSESS